jgi:hypothetical protein
MNEFKGLKFSSMALPWIPVGHPRYVWRPSADCDVTRTWREYGWKPLDEQPDTTQVQTRATVRALRQM